MPEPHFVLVPGSWHDGSLIFTNPRLLAGKLVEAGRD